MSVGISRALRALRRVKTRFSEGKTVEFAAWIVAISSVALLLRGSTLSPREERAAARSAVRRDPKRGFHALVTTDLRRAH